MTTILLVEDETAVRKVARRVLEREGFAVLEAGSAGAALDLVEQHEGEIALVLSDIVMPDMTGAELGRAVHETCPEIPILYMSGYDAEEMAARVGKVAVAGFLTKPFTPTSLMAAVRGALDN